jgi:hypothetical protein
MIRYVISDTDLDARIEAESPGWLVKAAKRTAACRKKKAFDGREPIWSDVKPVYMRLQHNKCAYCERKLEGEPYGRIEHDVEHFRPKSGVKAWPDERITAERKIDYGFPTGKAWTQGYYLLAFHPGNYITACKSCNTPLKSNYFPIAGKKRGPQSNHPARLAKEQPYLLYPLGSHDDDPEEVLTFEGIVPRPSKRSGHRRCRAVVTIDFFELDTREELLRGRAEVIWELKLALIVEEHPPTPADKAFARRTIARLQSEQSPHCNCARSFIRLYRRDPARADKIVEATREYLESLDFPITPTADVSAEKAQRSA